MFVRSFPFFILNMVFISFYSIATVLEGIYCSNAAVSVWVGESVRPLHFIFVGTIQTTVFAQSLSTSHVCCSRLEKGTYWFSDTGSKVNVNSGILTMRPWGHDTDYSFCSITFKLNTLVVHKRNPIDFGSRDQRPLSKALCLWNIVDKVQTTVFAQSL